MTPRRLIAALLVVTGCAGYASYSPLIDEALVREDYPAALAVVEKIDRSNSELLYCYEKALVLCAQGEYAASNEALERAETLIEELYTRSVTREVAALVVSETVAQYRGDAFEAIRVNYYKILNYLALDDVDGALVECRRLNRKLQMLHDGGETYFVDDPFLQYLTALVYEMGGEFESAGVSYRTASARYDEETDGTAAEAPPCMYCDASANARRRGDAAAAAAYDSLADCSASVDATGRLTVVIEAGRVVRKLESNLVLPIFEKDDWSDRDRFAHELALRRGVVYDHPPKVKYWLRVSLPVLEVRPPGVAYATVRATPTPGRHGVVEVRSVRVEDLDAQAAQAFREKESTVLVRAIIRGLGKFLASEAARDKDDTLGALVNLIGAATETADTRSWTTLPEAILVGRLDLPEGRYRLDADVVDGQGRTVNRIAFGEIDVRAGDSRIHTARAY